MKTIEQIVEEHCMMPTVSMTTFENEIKSHIIEICKEQRKICGSFIPDNETFVGISDLVENAPEPTIK